MRCSTSASLRFVLGVSLFSIPLRDCWTDSIGRLTYPGTVRMLNADIEPTWTARSWAKTRLAILIDFLGSPHF
jgi:hypothetical protein